MTIRQALFCGVTTLISIIGALALMAVAVDLVSIPNPAELIGAHRDRVPHSHTIVATR
jgi:hypothetical protein